jgi:hypothetical protein
MFIYAAVYESNILIHDYEFKITVFWDMAPYSFVDRYQRFGGTCCLCLQDLRANVCIRLPSYTASLPSPEKTAIFIVTAEKIPSLVCR